MGWGEGRGERGEGRDWRAASEVLVGGAGRGRERGEKKAVEGKAKCDGEMAAVKTSEQIKR